MKERLEPDHSHKKSITYISYYLLGVFVHKIMPLTSYYAEMGQCLIQVRILSLCNIPCHMQILKNSCTFSDVDIFFLTFILTCSGTVNCNVIHSEAVHGK